MKALLVAAAALLAPLATATERPPLPACPSGNFTPFISKGCYSDDGSKALDFRSPSSQYSMTVEQCTAECKGNGYRYAGLKYYGVCYCGSSLSAAKVDDSQCSLACSGDKKEVCGGNTQLSVWEDPTFAKCGSDITINDYESLGCYDDDGSSEGRALNHKLDLDASTFTAKICLDACRVRGYAYAGTENGNECWCGTNVGSKNIKVDDAKCDMPCQGSPSGKCGGRSVIDLYHAKKLESGEPCSGFNTQAPVPSSTATRTRTRRCSARRPLTSTSPAQSSPSIPATTPAQETSTPIPSATSQETSTPIPSTPSQESSTPTPSATSQESGTPLPSMTSSEGTGTTQPSTPSSQAASTPAASPSTSQQESSTTPQISVTSPASTTPQPSTTISSSSTPAGTEIQGTSSSDLSTPVSSTPGASTTAVSQSSTPSATGPCTGDVGSCSESTPVASSSTIVPSGVSTTEPCTDNIASSTLAASTTPQGSSTPGSSTPDASIPGTSTAGPSTAGTSTPAPSTTQVSSTEPCSDDISSTVTPSSTSSSVVSTTSTLATSTSQLSSSTTPSTSPSSTVVPSTTAGAGSTSSPGTTTAPTTTQRPSTTSTQSMCTATHTQPATCEFKCGNWCAPALPDWKDKNSCLNAAKTCSLQVASCFKTAGWPKAIECFDFSKWCGQVEEYCHSDCPSGNCGKTDCWNKRKPSGSNGTPPTVSTTVYPCPATSTMATSVARPSTTSHCAPTPTNICKQPTNTDWGYGPGKPVAGVPLPVVGCNDNKKDWKSNPFKFYNHPDSRSCQSFTWNQRPNVCADACQEQYEDCVDTYVQSCNDQSWRNGSKYHKRTNDNGGCAASNTGSEWRKSGCDKVHCWGQGGNDGNTAQKRCKAQYQDCLAVNKNMQPSNQCQSWCDAKGN